MTTSYTHTQHAQYSPETYWRDDFNRRLSQLTFNSRPLIQDLSMLAQSWAPTMPHIVAEGIENQLRAVAADFKLPVFYLLDSIIKNVPEPYARLFAPRITRLFLDVYYAVDPNTKEKMREMLVTWRTALGGAPVFRSDILNSIESGVYGVTPSASQVSTELEVLYGLKQRAIQANPYDDVSKRHLNTLNQLRTLLPTIGSHDLAATLTTLREIARSSATANGPPPPPPPPPPAPVSNPGLPPGFDLAALSSLLNMQIPQNYGSVPPPNTAAPVPPPVPAAPALNAASINALLSVIQGRFSGTPPVGSHPTVTVPTAIDTGSMTVEEYEDAILRCEVKLTSSEITKTKPKMLPFLYAKTAPQCKDCGIRFPAGEHGKQLLRDHLDKHFRQNMKSSEGPGRGFSRSWFVGHKIWTTDVPEQPGNKSGGKRVLTAKQAEKAEAEALAQTRKDLESKWMPVPVGKEGKPGRCRICMEDIPIEFLEDEEQWVWRNAVMIGSKVYHATCHFDISRREGSKVESKGPNSRQSTPEISSSNTSAQKRLLLNNTGSPGSSRRATPPKPSPLAGQKRKQEEVDRVPERFAGVKNEPETPPLKKLAIALPSVS